MFDPSFMSALKGFGSTPPQAPQDPWAATVTPAAPDTRKSIATALFGPEKDGRRSGGGIVDALRQMGPKPGSMMQMQAGAAPMNTVTPGQSMVPNYPR